MSQVAYLGPEGTFSGILARQRFGKKADLIASTAIEGVFESVLSGATPLGLVPVENSSGGTVYDTIDLLIRHAGSIYIVEELALDIRIALLGRNGTPIKTVYSHFTQIKHHAEWLKIQAGRRRSQGCRPRFARRGRNLQTRHPRHALRRTGSQCDEFFHRRPQTRFRGRSRPHSTRCHPAEPMREPP
jgi:hypothetical protein